MVISKCTVKLLSMQWQIAWDYLDGSRCYKIRCKAPDSFSSSHKGWFFSSNLFFLPTLSPFEKNYPVVLFLTQC